MRANHMQRNLTKIQADRIARVQEKQDLTEEIIQPKLLLLPGGKDSGGGNWLANLNVGAVFLAKPKMPTPQPNQPRPPEPFDLQFWVIVRKTPKLRGVQLELTTSDGAKELWVDPVVFSNTFIHIETLDDGVPWEDDSNERLDLDNP